MPEENKKTEDLSEQEKITLAKKAVVNYIQAMFQLTREQRQILIKGMSRFEKKEIKKIKDELQNI